MDQQRLVRAQHRRRGEGGGLDRLLRVRHVEHDHAEPVAGLHDDVGREEPRRVVVGAGPPCVSRVAQHLEAAGARHVGDQLGLHSKPLAARPLSWSAADTRPCIPVSGSEPGPQSARGTAAGSGALSARLMPGSASTAAVVASAATATPSRRWAGLRVVSTSGSTTRATRALPRVVSAQPACLGTDQRA